MKKRFNVTGACHPTQHYMADTSAKLNRVMEMIEQGDYFTINRPRQYGKTTLLFQLIDPATHGKDYIVLDLSFEGLTDEDFKNEAEFCRTFLRLLQNNARIQGHLDLSEWIRANAAPVSKLSELSQMVTDLVGQTDKKMALLIDEVDKSSDNQMFLNFLGMLRNKYLQRHREKTFHSVILTGVHDVKTLKIKIRAGDERKYNSPWNIAADFEVDMNLQPGEIAPMLEEYARDRGVTVNALEVAERLFYYTAGYPFLVSKLCKMFDEKMLSQKTEKSWTAYDVDAAATQLIGETNTNFDELIKNIRNNPELYELVQDMLLEGQDFSYSPNSDRINLGLTYGVFADRNKRLVVHNRIYQEVIFNYLSANAEHTSPIAGREHADSYCMPGNRFDVRKALLKFQELLKAEYSKKDRDFLERQGRLVFLAFLVPILNGHGNAFKEPQISEERRLDVVIAYHQHRHVIELKLWRGPKAHEAGLDQLADYLDRLGLDEGALLIFDHSEKKDWKQEEIAHRGKRIFGVWV
jgi:AAA-like domain